MKRCRICQKPLDSNAIDRELCKPCREQQKGAMKSGWPALAGFLMGMIQGCHVEFPEDAARFGRMQDYLRGRNPSMGPEQTLSELERIMDAGRAEATS